MRYGSAVTDEDGEATTSHARDRAQPRAAVSWSAGLRGGLFALAAAALCGLTTVAGAARVGDGVPAGYRTDAVLVAFRENAPLDTRLAAVNRAGLTATGAPGRANRHFAVLRLSDASRARRVTVPAALAALRADPAVRIAEPDYAVRHQAIPNDPDFSKLYGLHNTGQDDGLTDADIDAPEAWEVTTGSKSVIVAVIDTGVDYRHPDLDFNILRDADGAVVGYDFANGDPDPMDDNGHGTHVSGTIGARGNNGLGVVGVNHVVRIMPVKFLDSGGGGYYSGAIDSIDFAVANGARILSNSWGGGGHSQLLLEAIQRAEAAGVLFVAAAGNDASNNDQFPVYPASHNQEAGNVVSVAATDERDELAYFTNFGPRTVDLSAPGVRVLSTTPGGTYSYFSGTSMATPHVSGAAALALARYPALTLTQLKLRLLNSTDPIPATVGRVLRGRLNAAAVLEVDNIPPAPPTVFQATHRGPSGLVLSWLSSGDDGTSGPSSGVELRYSTQPITEGNYAAAKLGTAPTAPAASGVEATTLLSGLESDTDYYAAIRALDNVGNPSQIATLGPLHTLPSPVSNLLYDGAEGALLFSGTGSWGVTTTTSRRGDASYADSPAGEYANDVTSTLTQVTSRSLGGGVTALSFYARMDLEYGADILYVEQSRDNGTSWQPLGALTGVSDWAPHQLDISGPAGPVKVRFRLVTDESVTRDGVYLDEIRLSTEVPICTFEDTAEGAPRFSGMGGWAVTNEDSNSPTHSYSDSPGVFYPNGSDAALTQSVGLPLLGFIPRLRFWMRLDLEPGYDTLEVQLTADDGETWEPLARYTGGRDWAHYELPLDRFFGENIRIRFQLNADITVNAAGAWVDDIRICGEPLAPFQATAPPAPTNLQATAVSAAQINLTWASESATVTGFRVERSEAGGSFLPIAFVPGEARAYADRGLRPATLYAYRLRANSLGLDSDYSTQSSTTTPATPAAPAAPGNLRAKLLGRTDVRLTWSDNSSDEESYRLERRVEDEPYRAIEYLPANTTSFNDLALAPETSFTYRVVAVRAGAESVASNEAVATTRTAPPPGRMRLSTSSLSFGTVIVGRKLRKRVTIKNVGPGVLTGSVGTLLAPFTVVSGGGAFTLAPSKTRVAVIEYAPTSAAESFDYCIVRSNDPDLPITYLYVSGTGVVATPR